MKNFPARLGISAEVTVDITNQDLPKLAQEPIKRSVATTSVFDLEWDRLEKTIEQIVQDNMNKNET